MKLSVALRLGRVSNLPTVTSNVLAGVALAGGSPSPVRIALIALAMSLMYVAGMFLNDAFDRDIDARERPDRPIPAGEVRAAQVFDAGFALLLGGIAITALVALVGGAGWRPVMCAIALGALIIFYDAYHKQNPLSPVVMGLCRVGVYATAAFATARDADPALGWGTVAVLGYLIGLTYIARQENLARFTNLWPLAVLMVPFWIALPHDRIGWVFYLGFLGTTYTALSLLARRQIRGAVTLLIAGISLLDACLAASAGCYGMAVAAVAAFAATRGLQRFVPGT
jgi:4-hydroxybenzoate polyprenyltransferase